MGKVPRYYLAWWQKLAVQFVLNLEEGGENSIIYGDEHSETFLSEIIGAEPFYGKRHMSIEAYMSMEVGQEFGDIAIV